MTEKKLGRNPSYKMIHDIKYRYDFFYLYETELNFQLISQKTMGREDASKKYLFEAY